jgi:hypothetical protein
MGRFRKKKRWKQPEQGLQSVQSPIGDNTSEVGLDIDMLTAAPLAKTELSVPLQAEMEGALGKLMHTLGIGEKDYFITPEPCHLSLKEKFSFKSREDCNRAMSAVQGFLRITRTEYFEDWDKEGKKLLSPFKHSFVAVADNKAPVRNVETAYGTMIDALEQANKKLRLDIAA